MKTGGKPNKRVIVGGTLEEAGRRFADTWERAARGEPVEPQSTVTFVSWTALNAVMTDKRHALLRHLRRHPAPSVLALARAVKRDYKRVHEDVAALERIGLVERKGRELRADYDRIRAEIVL